MKLPKNLHSPHHVAVIPDGNRRWAKSKGYPTFEGHRKGYLALLKIAKKARSLGIKVMTVWAFSTENWDRAKEEVSYLMKLYEDLLDKFLKDAVKERIRIVHLGRKDRIPKILKEKIIHTEERTRLFTRYFLAVALDYGGRDEMVRAVKKISNSQFPISKFNTENFNLFLDTKDLPYPYPDLIIRTGGEQRLSGFMLWQNEYSELMFVQKYLPDFTPNDFENCINEYAKRHRRYGT